MVVHAILWRSGVLFSKLFGSPKNRIGVEFGKGLAFKLARAGVLVAITVGILLSTFQVYLDYGSQRAALDRQIEELLGVAEKPAARAVFTIDYALAEQVAQSLLIYDFVVEAKIYGDHDELLGASKKDPDSLATNKIAALLDDLIEIRRPLSPSAQQSRAVGQGEMVILISRGEALSGFVDRSIVVFLVGLARNIFLTLVLLYVFHTLAARPLRHLVEGFRKIDSREPGDARVACPTGHEMDELGALSRAGDRFVTEVSEQIAIRMAAERLLEEQVAETQAALNASNVANEAKTTFLAHMSHELRTPLNAIIGYSELITVQGKSITPDKNVEFVEQIHSAGKILLSHIDDILTFSELDNGSRGMELKDISLRAHLADALKLIRLTMRSHQITTKITKESGDCRVWADTRALSQVLVNVLTNAMKFSPDGSTIEIDVRSRDGLGIVTIRDEGPGIDPLEIERVLEPFARSSDPMIASQPGTGLGLPISVKLMEQIGGSLKLEPGPMKGLTVRISVPLVNKA